MDEHTDMSILVVDDEPTNVLLLEKILSNAGYRTVTATTDPREAVATFGRQPLDLLLVDLSMEHLDGYAVMAALEKAKNPGEYLPVLVLTADVTEATRRRALAEGATDFLTKPFDAAEVVLRIKNLLHTRRLYQELRARNAQLEQELLEQRRSESELELRMGEQRQRVSEVLRKRTLASVFQPIVGVVTGHVVGVEAFTRFPTTTLPPEVWFREAAEVGLAIELELLAARTALQQLSSLPEGVYVALNFSPETLLSVPPAEIVGDVPPDRVVIEVTEQAVIHDYPALARALRDVREFGMRVAVDDTGAGFSSLQRMVRLAPDVIKLDISLTRDIDVDPAKRALAAALVQFGADTNVTLVAEGVERAEELETLRSLGVNLAQGYYLGSPCSAEEITPRAF